MKKKFFLLLVLVSVMVFTFANDQQGDILVEDMQQDFFINLVKVKIVMPDASEGIAVVPEGEDLKITLGEELFVFSPKVTTYMEQKSAIMEHITSSSDEAAEAFEFEIIDVFSTPLSEMQKMVCQCCLTCGSTTVCACGVAMCNDVCCCPACCAFVK